MIGAKLKRISALVLVIVSANSCLAAHAEKQGAHGKIIKSPAFKPHAKTKLSEHGKSLFSKYQCSTCHTIGDQGGCLAPPLDGIGARRTAKFMNERIVIGEEEHFADLYGKSELMPHLRISKNDANAVVEYLLTLPAPKVGFQVIGHGDTKHGASPTSKNTANTSSASADSVKRGRQLLTSKGCLACHSLGNLGGAFARKFDGIASRLSRVEITQQMKNADLLTLNEDGEYGARGTVMPPMNLSDKEVSDLADFLVTLK